MKRKCISLRFNLENETDRKAWEQLQQADTSRNKAIITAINAYFGPDDTKTAELIRNTIHECLQGISITAAVTAEPDSSVSEEENALLDSMDNFLGG